MSALSDITAQASNNIKRHSPSSIGYQILQSPAAMEKENLDKSMSPHFMTPTFSSSKQSAAADRKLGDRTTPSSSKLAKNEGNNAWMKSAAKRVGFRRGGDGMPRSRKETLSKPTKAISFPDKFATPSGGMASDSPPSGEKKHVTKTSPNDKPLPSPPVLQVQCSISSIDSKSLIDASDKPLRRSSTGLKEHEEDWPVLQPRRSASPGTLQEMMRDTGAQLSQQAISSPKERYPKLGNTVNLIPDEQLPVSKFSATYKTPHKGPSSLEPNKKSDERKAPAPRGAAIDDDPYRVGVYKTDLTSPMKPTATSTSGASAYARAADKLVQDSKPTIEPRQNRTSVLRARLSAGQVVNDGQNKTTGFTDFTAPNETSAGTDRRGSLRSRKEAQARRSTTPPIAPSLHTKTSKDSIGASRAPAQFVAGSRRPAHLRRPGSRGSNRNETRGPSPSLSSMPPGRAAPTKPVSKNEDTNEANTIIETHQSVDSSEEHASPIPVSRMTLSNVTNLGGEKFTPLEFKTSEPKVSPKSPKWTARDENGIYEDHSSQDIANLLSSSPPPTATTVPAPYLIDNKDSHTLPAIEESPQHAVQLKRLSTHSPEYGPTLRISAAAERFIMGPSPKKEGRLRNKQSKDDLKNRKSNTTPPSTTKDEQERPRSSQGLSSLASRVGLVDPKAREKKVKSADLSLTSPKMPERNPERMMQNPDSHGICTSNTASKASASTSNDPFYDAPEELAISPRKDTVPDPPETHELGIDSEGSWISPLTSKSQERHVADDITPRALQMGFGDELDIHDTASKAQIPVEEHNTTSLGSASKAQIPVEEHNTTSLGSASTVKDIKKDSPTEVLPSTPQKSNGKLSTHSASHPLQVSSRTAPPDWTGNKGSPSAPTAEEIPPPTPPKDFKHRQNNLDTLRGHASQVDPKHFQSNQTDLREPTARDSFKSQTSISKGNSVLSNLKGLFHKRSTETNEPTKSTKGGKPKSKPKVSVSQNGSPFPPIPPSEIHPLHRPTLASTNRSKPITPRPTPTTAPTPTPQTHTPAPTSLSTTQSLAMSVLDAARTERSSPKKERLLQLGQIMVEGITQAREAEKCAEEARLAARRAEVARERCERCLRDVGGVVQGWKGRSGLRGGDGGFF